MGDFNVAPVISSGLTPWTNIPTRISNKSATLIDNVVSSIHSVRNEVQLSDTSDLFPVGVLLPLPRLARRTAPDNKPRFRYTPANIEKLKDDLFTTSWEFTIPERVSLENYNVIFDFFI